MSWRKSVNIYELFLQDKDQVPYFQGDNNLQNHTLVYYQLLDSNIHLGKATVR
jgi:hypothetical protein